MDIDEMKHMIDGRDPCIWHPLCLSCKMVHSIMGWTDNPDLVCPECGAKCEDANDMLASGKLTMTFNADSINEGMARGKSLGECL